MSTTTPTPDTVPDVDPRAVRRKRLDPLRNYRLHWEPWGDGTAPCGVSHPRKLTQNPADVDCGNCQHSRFWPTV